MSEYESQNESSPSEASAAPAKPTPNPEATRSPLALRRKKQRKHKALILFNAPSEAEQYGAAARNAEVQAVAQSLHLAGMRVAAVDLEDDVDRLLAATHVERPTLVVNLVDQVFGDNTMHGLVMGYMDMLGYGYTGSDCVALALCTNRGRTRALLSAAGLPVPAFRLVYDVALPPDLTGLRTPVIVTQAFDDIYEHEGIENGIDDLELVQQRIETLARDYAPPLLVEEWVAEERFHVFVVGGKTLDVLPIVGEELPWPDYEDEYDYEADDESAEEDDEGETRPELEAVGATADDAQDSAGPDTDPELPVTARVAAAVTEVVASLRAEGDTGEGGEPEQEDAVDEDEDEDEDERTYGAGVYLADLTPEATAELEDLARRAFRVMGCRDWAQIDIHLDEDGKPYIVDVRPLFDLRLDSLFHLAASETEHGYDGIIRRVAELAASRGWALDEEHAAEAPPAGADAAPEATDAADGVPVAASSDEQTTPNAGPS